MSTYFDPDKHSKTVEIPVRIKKGNKVEFFYDGALPNIKEDTLCRLIVPVFGVDKENQKQLVFEKTITLLPKGSRIFMAIKIESGNNVERSLLEKHGEWREQLSSEIKSRSSRNILQNGPVEIILCSDLKLTLRGTKRAKLESCDCYIPLLDANAGSLNQAYTKISQVFERHRASHTGSAFRSMYYFDQAKGECISLDDLRGIEEAKDERERFTGKIGKI